MSTYSVGKQVRIGRSSWKDAESDTLRGDYVYWSKSRKAYAKEYGGDDERHQLLLTEDFDKFLSMLRPELKDLKDSIQLIFTALSSEQACQIMLSQAEAALASAQSEMDAAVEQSKREPAAESRDPHHALFMGRRAMDRRIDEQQAAEKDRHHALFMGHRAMDRFIDEQLAAENISRKKATVEKRTTELNQVTAAAKLSSLPTESTRALDTRLLEVEQSLDAKADKDASEDLDQRILEVESHLDALKGTMSLMDQKPAFWTLFKTIDVPQTVAELDAAVDKLVELHATAAGIDVSHRASFLNALHADGSAGIRPNWMDEVGYKATRYWTSAVALGPGGPSFCSVVANANRTDNGHLLINGGISFQKALNSVIVTRGKSANLGAKFPGPGLTHRGCGIPRQKLAFWTVGKKYRAPSPLASSLKEDIARRFLGNVNTDTLDPVHFVLNWKRTDRTCQHACYVEGVTAVSGEEEIVVVAYSAFEVTDVQLQPTPTVDNPHKICIDVFPDNREQPESLPLAIWH